METVLHPSSTQDKYLAVHKSGVSEPVAIIGMVMRGPGVRNVQELWKVVVSGTDAIHFFPPGDNCDPNYVPAEGVLEDADCFDNEFFGISAIDAALCDPQHRVFMEAAWSAIEDAGYDPRRYAGRIGIFGGAGIPRYWLGPVARALQGERTGTMRYRAELFNGAEFLTTRTANKLRLRGPAMTINTACSTSLVAVHLAKQSLLAGECDIAIAGGVSVASLLPEDRGYTALEGGILSPKGRCRPFCAESDGTVKSSGVALVVLKRLAEAQSDGDSIRCVILGSAMNNDGGSSIGFSAPSEEGQIRVLQAAYAAAGVDPGTVSFVEAHGTGTALGDATEVAALKEVFGSTGRTSLTAVKSNLGHLDAAAGAASLIKASLALEHRAVPGIPGFSAANSLLELEDSPFVLHADTRALSNENGPLRAGVTSIGMGGTNVHVVLEEAPVTERRERSSRSAELICLSAKSEPALDRIHEQLQLEVNADLGDIAYTLAVGRGELPFRRAIVLGRDEDLSTALSDRSRIVDGAASPSRNVTFLFPGQGAQYVNMGRELYRDYPTFRSSIDEMLALLMTGKGLDLAPYLLHGRAVDQAALNEAGLAQPATFIISYALAQLMRSWGMEPSALFGHSLGEYTAACLAGVFSLGDALGLVADRGRMMQSAGPGAMLSMLADRKDIESYLPDNVSVATEAPGCTILSGAIDAIDAVTADLTLRGFEGTKLSVTQAYHSTMMQCIRDAFEDRVAQVPLFPPEIPILSCVTGDWLTDAEATNPAYWADHLCGTVTLSRGFEELLADSSRVFLEVGPGRSMHGFLRRHPQADGELVSVTTLPKADEQSASQFLLHSVGRLWVAGVSIDWNGVFAGESRCRIPLPTYPFERRVHMISAAERAAFTLSRELPAIEAIEQRLAGEIGLLTLDERPGVREGLSSLSTALVYQYFVQHGDVRVGEVTAIADLRSKLNVLPKFERMFNFLLRTLHARGIAQVSADRVGWIQDVSVDEARSRFLREHSEFSGWVRFIEHCIGSYAEAFSGEAESIGILYPDGTDAFYNKCMEQSANISSEELYLKLGCETVVNAVAKNGGKARILEVGAGHGTFTWPLLEALRPHDVEYHFTDIGRSFLTRAKEEADRRGLPSVKPSRFDLNVSPRSQGLAAGSFDMVVGFNAVHTARDTEKTVGMLSELLKPGGMLLLVEATRIELWEQLTWGLAPGFWDFEDNTRGSLAHDEQHWRNILGRTGFVSSAVLPQSGHSHNHALVIGQRDMKSIAKEPPVVAPVVISKAGPVHLEVSATSSAEMEVTKVWKRLLGLDSIARDNNFFELGGDSLLAVQLLSEIRTRFGAEIKVSQFSRKPTIAGMMLLIKPGAGALTPAPVGLVPKPTAKSLPECIVPLQTRGSLAPLFFVHPVGGSALCYYPLAARLGDTRPFYGVQASGQHESLAAMAASYVTAIREVQSSGPYYLGGWSFGAIVAQEMARQLEASGQTVANLILIDVPAKRQGDSKLARYFAAISASRTSSRANRIAGASEFLAASKQNMRLLAGHIPGRVMAPITHFRAAKALWYSAMLGSRDEVSSGASVYEIPGDHFSMMTNEASLALLAAGISSTLDGKQAASGVNDERDLLVLAQRFLDLTAEGPNGNEVVDQMFVPGNGGHLFDSYDSNFIGFDAIRQVYLDEFPVITEASVQLYDTTVRVAPGGQSAWVAGRIDSELTLRRSGRRISFPRTRITWVFEKHAGTWKVSHLHFSIPVGVPLRMME